MPTIDIGGGALHPSYATVAEADTYLAADILRGPAWAARPLEQRARALVSATRFLRRLTWPSAIPDPALVDQDPDLRALASLLAADLAANPDLLNGGGGNNVKRAKGGSAEVEFFNPVKAAPIAQDILAFLSALGIRLGGKLTQVAGAYGLASGTDQQSYFDQTDYRLREPFQ